MTKNKKPVDPQEAGAVDKAPGEFCQSARKVFETHTVDELFFTVDGTCFTEMYQAQAHSVSLGNDKIITIKRGEV